MPTYWDKTKDKNGFCIQDIRKNAGYGGHCVFPNQVAAADGSAAETFTLTAADFESLKNLWTSTSQADGNTSTPDLEQGALYYD